MVDIVYWIWLSLATASSADVASRLLLRFGDARGIFSADEIEIAAVIGSRSQCYKALADKKLNKAQEVLDFCSENGIGLLSLSDSRYPVLLKNIPSPPVLLYYRGNFPDFDSDLPVAVVGTRRNTSYGRRGAYHISYELAKRGALIVSGMAMGIDGTSHAAALAASGRTVAVLGCGVDVVYPKGHATLASAIAEGGCIISEYAPGTRAQKYTFPARNRIISGLSRCTLVVEGKEKSGARITAAYAEEQGRPIYAVPGNVDNETSELPNRLLKNGAKACTSAEDIISDFEEHLLKVTDVFSASGVPDMFSVLRSYEVMATAPDDPIFDVPKTKRTSRRRMGAEKTEKSEKAEMPAPNPEGLDKFLEGIYQRIPADGDCAVESLVGDGISMREVMRGLFKLEVAGLISLLPGERVRRN